MPCSPLVKLGHCVIIESVLKRGIGPLSDLQGNREIPLQWCEGTPKADISINFS